MLSFNLDIYITTDICQNHHNRWLFKQILAKCKIFQLECKKTALHTVLSQDNFCGKFTHFQVKNFLASNCACVKKMTNIRSHRSNIDKLTMNCGKIWHSQSLQCFSGICIENQIFTRCISINHRTTYPRIVMR